MMLRIDEVVSITFENVNHVPDVNEYFDVTLSHRKTAQAGVGSQFWRLWANDTKPWLCPKRAQILLAMVYGESIDYSGAMFRMVDANGIVQANQPIVCLVAFCFIRY